MFDSFLLALVAATVYIVGFVAIHRFSAAKWFTLEVFLGALIGCGGMAIGFAVNPHFHVERFVALYGMCWFCFFFVSGVFYASVSVSIIRFLADRRASTARIDEVFQSCIEAPFTERVAFLSSVGQIETTATTTNGSVEASDGEPRYSVSAKGSRTALRIRRIQALFGFAQTGFYSVPKNDKHSGGNLSIGDYSRITPKKFWQIGLGLVMGWAMAQTSVSHGIRPTALDTWVKVALVCVLTLVFSYALHAAIVRLGSQASRSPSNWVLWAPFTLVALVAQLVGLRWGSANLLSDWLLAGFTAYVAVYALRLTPIRELWPLFLVWLIQLFAMWSTNNTGIVHLEAADRYFPVYLTDRSWLDILYDPVAEFGDNRSRPLSLAFDCIDYRFVHALAQLGIPRFQMMSFPAFSLAILGSVYWFFVRDLRLSRVLALAAISLYQTVPAIAIHCLYRSAKIGAGMMLIIVLIQVYRLIAQLELGMRTREAANRILWIWVACFVMPMFDELGTYSIGMLAAALGAYAIVRRTHASWTLFGAVASTAAAAYFNRYVISSNLYLWVNGTVLEQLYNLNTSTFEHMPFERLGQAGWEMVVDTARILYGNSPRAIGTALLVIMTVCFERYRIPWGPRPLSRPVWGFTGLVFAGVVGMLILQFAIMIHFHPLIVYPDVRIMYYVIPTLSLMLILTGVCLKAFCANNPAVMRTMSLVLGLALLGNLQALPGYWTTLHSGHAAIFFNYATNVIKELEGMPNGAPPSTDPVVNLLKFPLQRR